MCKTKCDTIQLCDIRQSILQGLLATALTLHLLRIALSTTMLLTNGLWGLDMMRVWNEKSITSWTISKWDKQTMCVMPKMGFSPIKKNRSKILKGEFRIIGNQRSLKVAQIILQDLDYVHELKEGRTCPIHFEGNFRLFQGL